MWMKETKGDFLGGQGSHKTTKKPLSQLPRLPLSQEVVLWQIKCIKHSKVCFDVCRIISVVALDGPDSLVLSVLPE